MNGWITFVFSIIMIGILTAIVGDLASHLGCSIKLEDSVTAIAFVAVGTSIPGNLCLHPISKSYNILCY